MHFTKSRTVRGPTDFPEILNYQDAKFTTPATACQDSEENLLHLRPPLRVQAHLVTGLFLVVFINVVVVSSVVSVEVDDAVIDDEAVVGLFFFVVVFIVSVKSPFFLGPATSF